MTKKQQFIGTFIKDVFNFDEVKFDCAFGCMNVIAKSKAHNGIWNVDFGKVFYIYIDKTKTKGYSIKFKTAAIPEESIALVKQRAQHAWPGATIDIYNRHEPCVHKDMPTLRVRVKELPWK